VDDLGRGGGARHYPNVQKRKKNGVSGVRIGVWTDELAYGRTMSDRGGVSKKSVFARMSLIDDPLCLMPPLIPRGHNFKLTVHLFTSQLLETTLCLVQLTFGIIYLTHF